MSAIVVAGPFGADEPMTGDDMDVVPVTSGVIDREAEFTEFMARAAPALARTAWLLCGDEHEAEELVQLALTRTYLKWSIARQRDPLAYTRRTLANLRIDSWRKRRREVLMAPADVPEGEIASAAELHARRDQLVRALATLSTRQRRIVVLRLLVDDGDLTNATGIGPSGWGNLLIDGKRTVVSWDVLYGLPRDPAALDALFRGSVLPDAGNGSDDDKVFNMALDMQDDSPAPPTLKKALWAVMTAMPSATVTPGVNDALGRPGSLLEYTDSAGTGPDNAGGSRFKVVFDPNDGRLLEYQNPGGSNYATNLEEGPATSTPIEPTLESSGCTAWVSC